jgi:D-serine deaminase-like pyridoxal phosphate-dependent protein
MTSMTLDELNTPAALIDTVRRLRSHAMSRDRGTSAQGHDYGYGMVCWRDGTPLDGYQIVSANQEHGIVARSGPPAGDIETVLPIGTRLRILPNLACANGAQSPAYHAVSPGGTVATWARFYGW